MVGQVLREAREKAGLSQEQVAARAKITREYLSNVERDVKSPTIRVFVRICRALGSPAGTLLSRAERAGGNG